MRSSIKKLKDASTIAVQLVFYVVSGNMRRCKETITSDKPRQSERGQE